MIEATSMPNPFWETLPDAFMTELENLDDKLASVRSIVQGLPQANYDLLKRISEHLDKYVVPMSESLF